MREYYILLASFAIVMWMTATSNMRLITKIVMVTFVIGTAVGVFAMVESYRGMPKEAKMPEEMVIHGFMVQEPDLIYLWGIAPGELPPPVSYQMPYNRNVHQGLQGAREKHEGKPFLAKFKTDGLGEPGEGEPEGKGGNGEDGEEGGTGGGMDVSPESVTDIDTSGLPNPVPLPK